MLPPPRILCNKPDAQNEEKETQAMLLAEYTSDIPEYLYHDPNL